MIKDSVLKVNFHFDDGSMSLLTNQSPAQIISAIQIDLKISKLERKLNWLSPLVKNDRTLYNLDLEWAVENFLIWCKSLPISLFEESYDFLKFWNFPSSLLFV